MQCRKDSTPQLRRETAALRDFGVAYDGFGSFTSLWLLRSTVRMSASRPKATESLRSSEMTLSAITGREQMQQMTRAVIRSPRRQARAVDPARRGGGLWRP